MDLLILLRLNLFAVFLEGKASSLLAVVIGLWLLVNDGIDFGIEKAPAQVVGANNRIQYKYGLILVCRERSQAI